MTSDFYNEDPRAPRGDDVTSDEDNADPSAPRGESVASDEGDIDVSVPIGKLVRAYVPAILRLCEQDEGLFESLLDKGTSKKLFGLSWSFLKVSGEIRAGSHPRYWVAEYSVRGRSVRVSSQWFEDKNRNKFLAFLQQRGIASPSGAFAAVSSAETEKVSHVKAAAVSKARYKGNPIGNAQNAFVRTLLSNLRTESFTEKDWLQIVSEFHERCAYCDVAFDSKVLARRRVMDHAVPINRVSLGEHRLGNLVPACHACNSAKGQKDYRDFCTDEAAIARIEAHMERHSYSPIESEQIQLFVETAYKEVRELSQRYLLLINALMPDVGTDHGVVAAAPIAEQEEADRLARAEPWSVEDGQVDD